MNITTEDIARDVITITPLSIWVLLVINPISKGIYNLAIKKGYPENSATYFGRKAIHMLGAGVMTLTLPYLFREPFIPFLSGIGFTLYTYFFRRLGRLQTWFQVKENSNEVNFCIMWSLSILLGWFLDRSFWLGAVPALFISFGDGVTGVIRNIRYKKRNKSWEGSAGMLIVCVIIGAWRFGLAGIAAAVTATIAEKMEFIDDNISIIISSFLILAFFYIFFPQLTTPLI